MCFFRFYWGFGFWIWPGCGTLLLFLPFLVLLAELSWTWQIANVLVMQDFMNRWPITPLQKGIMSEFQLKVSYQLRTVLTLGGDEHSCCPRTGSVNGRFDSWCLCRPLFEETFNCSGFQYVISFTRDLHTFNHMILFQSYFVLGQLSNVAPRISATCSLVVP